MTTINKEKCIGCGLCASICGSVFKMDDDGKAEVKTSEKSPCVKEAIDSCPVDAIHE